MTNNSQPLIYAHRGASAYAPENTLSAFLLAAEQGADGVEFDVKLTRDDRVIILHDQTLERTTSGSGNFKKYTFDELRKLDAGLKFKGGPVKEHVPTLGEVFEFVYGKVAINIELTNYATPGDGMIEAIAGILANVKDHSKIMFSSFNWGNLKKARELCPDIPCGLLAMPGLGGWVSRSFLAAKVPHEALHPYFTDVNVRNTGILHSQGRNMNVWTVNDPKEMRRLKQIGVDMIMTDDPMLALKTLREEK